jgi:hypothetical protein
MGFPHAYFLDLPSRAKWADAAVTWYERAVLMGTPLVTPDQSIVEIPPTKPTDALSHAAAETLLLPYFLAADRLANRYATRYRAAGLMRYGLIIPATAGALLSSFGGPWIRAAGLTLQFTALVSVLVFSKIGWWERAQWRFIAYRSLAEYLRTARLLAALRATPQVPAAAVHQVKIADWTAWYGRAVVRCVGLTPGRLDPQSVSGATAFVRAEGRKQVTYLLNRATRFTALADRLRRIGVALFISGLIFEAARGVLLVTGVGGQPVLWLNELSLVLPALAPVFLGLLAFGEYGRLATRYNAVAAELQAELLVLDHAQPGRRAAVLPVGRRIAEIMLAESIDWQQLLKAGTLSAY